MRARLPMRIVGGLAAACVALTISLPDVRAQSADDLRRMWEGQGAPRPTTPAPPRPTPPVAQPQPPRPAPPVTPPPVAQPQPPRPVPPPATADPQIVAPVKPEVVPVDPPAAVKPPPTAASVPVQPAIEPEVVPVDPPAAVKPPPTPPPAQPASAAVAAKLRELTNGDAEDILLFINDTEEAPNAARNFRGVPTFRDGAYVPCHALDWKGGPEAPAAIKTTLARHGANRATRDLATAPCPEGRRPFDILAVQRGELQTKPPARVIPLVTDVVAKRLSLLDTVKPEKAPPPEKPNPVAAGLRDGTLKGVGLLLLNPAGTKVCAVGLDEDQIPAIRVALARWRADLPANVASELVEIVAFDRAGALAAAQRGDCGAAFGEDGPLRDLDAALRQRQAASTPHTGWLTPPEWEEIRKQAGVPITTADRRRALAPKVEPLAVALVADLKAFIAADGKSGAVADEFAAFAQWFKTARGTKAQISVDRFQIEDYGDATKAGGKAAAIAVVVWFNVAGGSGAPRAVCHLFGWVDDSGGVRKTPEAFPCDRIAQTEDWKQRHGLRSRWY
ncbi:MAG: hypothetical protein JNL07_11460 [Rhodospirillales bacterium]|nr:hypothetical protein [Rhodospirillales bacterium]